jgi:DNA-binding NtrC family response regulator
MSANTVLASPPDSDPQVLVVDDDAAITALATLVLQGAGFSVVSAADRPSALKLWRAHRFPVVLLDLGLPPLPHELDEGLSLLTSVLEEEPLVKVLVLTGQEENLAAFAAVRAGAFDFLAKPIGGDELIQAVRRALLYWQQEVKLRNESQVRLTLTVPTGAGLKTVRREAEEQLLRAVLHETGFNISETARRLGVKRENIYYFLKKHGIDRQPS